MSSRRMDGKSEDDLALDDKLDVARTFLALTKRIELRHEKNEVETAIKRAHLEEVKRGEISQPTVPDKDAILGLFGGTPAIAESGETSRSADANAA